MTEHSKLGSACDLACLASVSPACSRANSSSHLVQAVDGSVGGQALSLELAWRLVKMC